MKSIPDRLKSFLDDRDVHYQVVHHHTHYTSPEVAADTHTPGIEFAKTVIVKAGAEMIMFVVPAHHLVNCRKLGEYLGRDDVSIAREPEITELLANTFPQCRTGALPPFGELFGIHTYMSEAMLNDVYITFNAGTHEDVIRLAFHDYIRLCHPIFGNFSDSVRPAVTRRATI